MKIALIGYGKVNQLVEELALQKKHEIVAKIDGLTPINESALQHADICIDFSVPKAVVKNVELLAKLNKNIVMGTTGWYEEMDTVKQIVKEHSIGFLYSPNFSPGVLIFKEIVRKAAKLINYYDQYDISGFEMHHNQKADSPSGTAMLLTDVLLQEIKRKKRAVYQSLDRLIAPDELQFNSLRCGSICGTHSIILDSAEDTITLSHQAKTRHGFALGAILAGEWLLAKKGFYTFDHLLGEL